MVRSGVRAMIKRKKSVFFIVYLQLVVCGAVSAAFADEPKSEKKATKTGAEQKTAKANPTPKTDKPQAARASNASTPKPPANKSDKTSAKPVEPVKPVAKPVAKNGQTDTRFVDRDGDGLRDGKEHRFRGRFRRTNDSGSGRDTTSPQRGLRFQYRFGASGTTPRGPNCRRCQ